MRFPKVVNFLLQWGVPILIYGYIVYYFFTHRENLQAINLQQVFMGIAGVLSFGVFNVWTETNKWRAAFPHGAPTRIEALTLVLKGLFLGLITPNRLGEYIGRTNINFPLRKVWFPTFIARSVQSLPTLLFGSVALFYFPFNLKNKVATPFLILAFILGTALSILFYYSFAKKYKQHFFKYLLYLKEIKYTSLFFWTFFRYFGFCLGFLFFLKIYHSSTILFSETLGAIAIIYLLKSFVGTFFAGLGTRELIAGIILSPLGFSLPVIWCASITLFVANHILPAFLGSLIYLSQSNKNKICLYAAKTNSQK